MFAAGGEPKMISGAMFGKDRKRARNMSMSFAPWRAAVCVREPKMERQKGPIT